MRAAPGQLRPKSRRGAALLTALVLLLPASSVWPTVGVEPAESPPGSPEEDTLTAPAPTSAGNQPNFDEVKEKRKKEKIRLLMLLLLVTFIVVVLVFVIFLLSLRYSRYFFPLRKEVKPTKLEDVWWLADPKSGKPRKKKDDSP